MLDGEDASTREFRDLGKKRGTVELFRRTIAITKRVKNADGIELRIGFFHEPLDIVLVVPTMIIASIGEDEQGTFSVVCTPHLAKAEIDSIEESGPPFGSSHHHAALEVFDAVGEGARELGPFIETNEEKFVLGISGLEELEGGLAGFVDLVGHTAAKVEDNTNGNGDIFRGEADNFLLDIVFKDAEVVGIKAGDEAVKGVGNGNVDQGEVHIGADDFSGLDGYGRGVVRNFTGLGDGSGGRGADQFWLTGIVLSEKRQAKAKNQKAGEQAKNPEPKKNARVAAVACHGTPIPSGDREDRAETSS